MLGGCQHGAVDPDDDFPRTAEGYIDFGLLFEDPDIVNAMWRDAVPFWSVADRPTPEQSDAEALGRSDSAD